MKKIALFLSLLAFANADNFTQTIVNSNPKTPEFKLKNEEKFNANFKKYQQTKPQEKVKHEFVDGKRKTSYQGDGYSLYFEENDEMDYQKEQFRRDKENFKRPKHNFENKPQGFGVGFHYSND